MTIALLTALNIVAHLINLSTPQIPPLRFNNIPVPQLPPQNAFPQPDDPFAPPAINAHQYHHLPADLAQRLAALPPLQPAHGRGRKRGNIPPPPPVCNFF